MWLRSANSNSAPIAYAKGTDFASVPFFMCKELAPRNMQNPEPGPSSKLGAFENLSRHVHPYDAITVVQLVHTRRVIWERAVDLVLPAASPTVVELRQAADTRDVHTEGRIAGIDGEPNCAQGVIRRGRGRERNRGICRNRASHRRGVYRDVHTDRSRGLRRCSLLTR